LSIQHNMPKTIFLFLLLFFFNTVFSQDKYEQYNQQINFEKINLKKIEMLCNLGFYYADSSKAKPYFNKAKLLAKQENNLELSTLIDAKLAVFYAKFKNNKKKSEHAEQVVLQLPNLKNTNYTADIYYQMGKIEEDKTKELSYLLKGLEIAEKVKNYELATQICFNISGIYDVLLKTNFEKKYVAKHFILLEKPTLSMLK